MATDPSDIKLSPEFQARIAELEEKTGTDWSDLLDTIISSVESLVDGTRCQDERTAWTSAQEQAFEKVWDNEHDAIFDDL